jgi:CO dehydrogenase/acetyl-CoA synthase beta subunit
MQVSNTQVRTYVHGTFYALVAQPKILEESLQRGIPDMLRAVSATSEPVFQRHIAFILQKMQECEAGMRAPETDVSDSEENEEDDVDIMEYNDEFEEMEDVMSSSVALTNVKHRASP